MARKPFHLAWFISKGYGPKAWRMPWGGPNPASWVKPDLFVSLARELERAALIGAEYLVLHPGYKLTGTEKRKYEPMVLRAAARMIEEARR